MTRGFFVVFLSGRQLGRRGPFKDLDCGLGGGRRFHFRFSPFKRKFFIDDDLATIYCLAFSGVHTLSHNEECLGFAMFNVRIVEVQSLD